ncbi:MAG: rod-binding protein [Methylovirgula sp.]
MSINPPSDLLLDVARAADPATSAAAAERLAKIGARSGNIDAGFSDVLNGVGAPSNPSGAAEPTAGERVVPRLPPPVDASKKAYRGLEALLLQNLVETMLPKSADLFGKGSAGDIWRSMLARELGTDLSTKVDLGVEPRYLRRGDAASAHHAKTAAATDALIGGIGHVVSKHT